MNVRSTVLNGCVAQSQAAHEITCLRGMTRSSAAIVVVDASVMATVCLMTARFGTWTLCPTFWPASAPPLLAAPPWFAAMRNPPNRERPCCTCTGTTTTSTRRNSPTGSWTQGLAFYAVDMRGAGRSLEPGEHPHDMADIAEPGDDIAAACDAIAALHPGLPIVVHGHSTGGLSAAIWAADRPHPQLAGRRFSTRRSLDCR